MLFVNAKQRPPLGADTWVHLEIMRRLDRDRVEVHAACVTGPPNRPTPTFELLREIPDVNVRPVNLGRELSGETRRSKVVGVLSLIPALVSLVRLAWYVRVRRIDVIHTADRPRDAAASVVIGMVTRTPVLVHVHVGYDPEWMSGMLQWAIGRADGLVAISEFVAATLTDNGFEPEQVHLVPNGIDVDRWSVVEGRDQVRREFGLTDEVPVVVTACRLFRAKGVSALVQAIHDVSPSVPDAVLLVAGREMEDGYLAELQAMATDLGIADRVKFLGRRDDIVQVMAAADVFAMPSHNEPFGLVYAEAMAMGLPVVALDNGGTPEVVRHGLDGLLSPAGDDAALASNLAALLQDAERRTEFGHNGRRRVIEQLTSRRMAADAAEMFERVRAASRAATDRHIVARVAGGERNRGVEMNGDGLTSLDADAFREAMDRDGYVVIRDVVSPDALATLRDELLAEFTRLSEDGQLFEGGGLISGHLNCFPGERARFVFDEIRAQGIVDLIRSYRPQLADAPRATLNFNLPGSVPQHYHVDDAFLKEFLICNIAVVDTDLVNGAIDVLPGTNQEFWPFWRYALKRVYRRTTRLPLKCGDVVVRSSTLWHRGMPNGSSTPRPMMAVTFGEVDDNDDPFVANDGQMEFYPNWYRTSRLGQLRERVTVRAPITYSAYRFATSLVGKKGYESF